MAPVRATWTLQLGVGLGLFAAPQAQAGPEQLGGRGIFFIKAGMFMVALFPWQCLGNDSWTCRDLRGDSWLCPGLEELGEEEEEQERVCWASDALLPCHAGDLISPLAEDVAVPCAIM